jgi:isopentenyl-diphosphate delta-isomerase
LKEEFREMEKVILVNKKDKAIGTEEKLKAHQKGKLHRAFSVVLFNKKGEILIQKRAKSKYHSPGLWTNTCCSHPKPNENTKEAAQRRLKEEMGIKTDLKKAFSFIYKAKLGNLVEYEFDHVFLGRFDGQPKPNKKEIEDWQWIKLVDLEKDIKKNPKKYTPWSKIILKKLKKKNTR